MAVKDCLELSNILATGLLAGDESLAKLIAEVSSIKNKGSRMVEMFSKTADGSAEKIATEGSLMEEAADTRLRTIVYAKILSGDTSRDAYVELAKQMKKGGGTIANGLKVNEMLMNAKPADYAEIARLLGFDDEEVSASISAIQGKLNYYNGANYSFESLANFNKSGPIQELRLKFKKGEIEKEDLIKGIQDTWKSVISEAKKTSKTKKKAKTFGELEIKRIEAPKGVVNIDKEWYAISKIAGGDVDEAMRIWGNYCVAKAILADGATDDFVVDAFVKGFDGIELSNLSGELTVDVIQKIDSLDVLMARAFTNTKDLAFNKELRARFREKLTHLASSGNLSTKDVEKLGSLVNTAKFIEGGAMITDLAKYDSTIRGAKLIGLNTSYTNGKKLYEGIIETARELDIHNIPDSFSIAGCKMDAKDLVTLIHRITGDDNIIKLLKNSGLDENTVLGLSTEILLGKDKARDNLVALIKKANQQNSISNTKAVTIRAITGVDIGDDLPIRYFDYRKGLYEQDKLSSSKADMMNQLSNKNRMTIDGIDEISNKNITVESLAEDIEKNLVSNGKGGYLLVNDSQYRNNEKLDKALKIVNDKLDYENKIIVAYPRGGLMGQITSEGGEIVFKTSEDDLYNDIAGIVSIQTLGESVPDRGMSVLQREISTGRNADGIRYQITYDKGAVDNLGNKLSDQQVEYHAKSKMRDANGNLIRVYRGSTRHPSEALGKIPGGRESNHYADYGDTTVLFFSSSKNVAEGYGGEGFTRGKILKTFEDVVEEIENRDFSWFIEVTRDGDDIVLTASDDFILPGYEFNKGDELVRGTVKDIDTYLNEGDNVLTRGGLGIQYEAYLYAENPLIVDAGGNMYNHIMHNGKEYNAEQLALFAKENGYDGLIIRNVREDVRVDAADDYIVFGQNQVKGVDNKNPNIDEGWRFQEFKYSVDHRKTNTLIPTKKEVDEWLSKNSFTDLLKKELGTTDRIEDAIFITKDGELIDGSKFKMYVDGQHNYLMKYANVAMEHYTAVDALVFKNRSRVGKEGEWSDAATMMLPMIQDKEGLVRVRFFDGYEGGTFDFNIVAPHKKLTPMQENAMNKYFAGIDSRTSKGTKYRINIEGTGIEGGGGTILVDKGTFIDMKDIDKELKKINQFKYNGDEYVAKENAKIQNKGYEYMSSINKPFDDLGRIHDFKYQRKKGAVDNMGEALSDEQDDFFAESAIRADDGTLLRIYHGTKAEFTEFDPARLGKNMADGAEERGGLSFGDGFYATSDRESAMGYSETWGSSKGRGIVMEGYVNIKKPFMWYNYKTNEDIAKLSKELGLPEGFLKKNMFLGQMNKLKTVEQSVEFTEALKLAGYDGIWIKHPGGYGDEIVFFDSNQFKSINNKTPTSNSNILLQRKRQGIEGQATRDASMKLEVFRKTPNGIRTIEDIIKAYNIPVKDIEIIRPLLTAKGVEAYGAYGKGIIYLGDSILEGTVAHEVFHAVFDMVGAKKYEDILNKGTKLFGKTQLEVEEELADAFANYFKTGKFELFKGESVKLTGKKTFKDTVKSLFEELKAWIKRVSDYKGEVNKLFDDIINVKITPMDGTNIDISDKILEYNENLNNLAIKYYGDMLGYNGEVVSPEYINKVYETLSDRTGISINSFINMEDRGELWKMVNERYTLDKMATGKYDKVSIDGLGEINRIDALSDDELVKEISDKLGDLVNADTMKSSSLEFIKDAYKDFMVATDEIEYLQAKGKLISLSNGGKAENMSIDDIRNMFMNKTFSDTYKSMFFPNQELGSDDMNKLVKQINDNVFDLLVAKFSDNIVKAGYSLPMVSSRQLVYDFLNNKLTANNMFVQALFYKNGIPITNDNIRIFTEELMPKNIDFDYIDAMYKKKSSLGKGDINVIKETDNRFITESYSALTALEAIDRGATVNIGDRELLERILNKYSEEMTKGLEMGTLSFRNAQMLKQEASYALDMFEQDFLLPKYGRTLTTQERQGLMGMKYSLPISVNGMDKSKISREFDEIKKQLLDKYDEILGGKAEQDLINKTIYEGGESLDKRVMDKINARRAKLMSNGQIVVKVGKDYLVYDVRQTLLDTLDKLPDNIGGIGTLKGAKMSDLLQLSNEQAYGLLRYLEVAKNISNRATLAEELISAHNPMLAKLDFFRNFQINKDTGLPYALGANGLITKKGLQNAENLSLFDENVKKQIFGKIRNQFKSTGKGYVTNDDIKKYIKEAVDDLIPDLQNKFGSLSEKQFRKTCESNYYSAFTPYIFVKDIPDDVKGNVSNIMKAQYRQAKDDLSKLNIRDIDILEDEIYITLSDGTEKSLREASDLSVDSWKERIFGTEDAYIRGDEYVTKEKGLFDKLKERFTPESYKEDIEKVKEAKLKQVNNAYNSTLQTIINGGNIIDEADKRFQNAFMFDTRKLLRQNNLTSLVVDAIDASSGINEKAARGLKDSVIGFGSTVRHVFQRNKVEKEILGRFEKVKEAYSEFYSRTLEDLERVKVKGKYEDIALNLAKYFKTIENILGSADGLKGCTTDALANKAFFNLGEVVLNINSAKGVYTLMSGVDQQQILKFFKLSKKGQSSYYPKFVQKALDDSSIIYRDYVTNIVSMSTDEFNKLFGTNFGDNEFGRVLQGLTGFTLSGRGWGWASRAFDFINSSTFVERALMSYPFGIFTIPQQGIGYFLKQKGFEKMLGAESLSFADQIRMKFGILDGAYNEIPLYNKYGGVNLDDVNPNSPFNRYGVPDTEGVYKDIDLYETDNITDIYAKIDNYGASSESKLNKITEQLDPYKDNQNNIIDGIFSRNFKNLAFVSAIKHNDYMKFSTAKQFYDFMLRDDISKEVKDKLLDRVKVYSGREFRSMLALGFGGIDRFIGGNTAQNLLVGFMNLFNFRGSWGQNVFKQFGNFLYNSFYSIPKTLSQEGLDATIEHIAKQPEFINFTTEIFNSIGWMYRINRFKDNGQWPDDNDVYEQMSFAEALPELTKQVFTGIFDNAFVAQWMQGLQSFGPGRIAMQGIEQAMLHLENPDVYKDYGVGAFLNALQSNLGRNWKVRDWIADGILQSLVPNGINFNEYIYNEFWKLSAGTMRYMVGNDMGAYGYNVDLTPEQGGIPSIIRGETNERGDTAFSYRMNNDRVWEATSLLLDDSVSTEDKQTYIGNWWSNFVNSSRLVGAIVQADKIVREALHIAKLDEKLGLDWSQTSRGLADSEEFRGLIVKTDAGKQLNELGYAIPKTQQDAETFFNVVNSNGKYRPGSSSFTKSLINFDETGHMDGKTGTSADKYMEMWLKDMKGEKRTDGDSWDGLIKDVKEKGYNETYVVNRIYKYAFDYLERHPDTERYNLYTTLLGQGKISNLVESEIEKEYGEWNANRKAELKALGIKKQDVDEKWTKDEFKRVKLRDLYLKIGNKMVGNTGKTVFEEMVALDKDKAIEAGLAMVNNQIKDEADKKTLEKYFTVGKTEETEDGETYAKVNIASNFKSQLVQWGKMNQALQDGNLDRFLAESSTLSNMYMKEDPTGLVTLSVMDSIMKRIDETDSFSPELKVEIKSSLFRNNKDFLYEHTNKAKEIMGEEAYESIADNVDEIIYRWDKSILEDVDDIITGGASDESDANKKGSGVSKARGLSNDYKDFKLNSGNGGTGAGKQTIKTPTWNPIKISGSELIKELGLKGYTPNPIKISIEGYKPVNTFDILKDISRNFKTTKTQEVKKSKQLSSIESKTQKAIESES